MNKKNPFLSPEERLKKLERQTLYEGLAFRLRMVKVCIMLKNATIIHSDTK